MMRKQHLILFSIAAVFAILLCLSGGACLAQRVRPAPSAGSTGADTDRVQLRRDQRLRGAVTSWLGIEMKDLPPGSKTQGVLIESVAADSPAEKAGLREGDIITSLAGKPVTKSREVQIILFALSIGKVYSMDVLRGDSSITLTVRPEKNPAAGVTNGTTQFEDTPAPRKGPLDINVLKYALIDPDTRVVTFVGKYDPDYATGPIPYADILNDAMANPYPAFSIEPTEQQRAQFAQVDRMIASDIQRMNDPNYCNQWGQKLMNLLLNDSSLQTDNKRFFNNSASAMGITGDELKRVYDAAAGKIEIPQAETMQTLSKMMRGIGSPRAADGLLVLAAGGSPEELLRNMAIAMGMSSEYEELAKRQRSGDLSASSFKNEAIILCMSLLCREFGAPEGEINSRVSSIRSGRQPANVIVDYMAEQMGNFITNKAGAKILNGLVMSPELLSRFYNIPVPQSQMVFQNIAADSQLGDVLFKADYRLKTVCTYPDAREKMPAHLTDMEFMQREAATRNYDLPGGSGADVGHRLVPADVKMRVSPSGDIVEFQNSQVKVIGWVRGSLGNNDSRAQSFINEVTPKYADYLTEHYEEYSKVYPEWHKMSEVAKVVALTRWAKNNNYALKVANASGSKVQHPKFVNGFYCAVFQVAGDNPSLTLIAHGGASFSQDEGDGWVQTQPDVAVTANVQDQLVASAVLAKQAVLAADSGDLEAARVLADKSALAMTGELDLSQLPSLDGIPSPSFPANYAEATSEVISQASECMKTMDNAQKDLARAGQLAATSPDEAAKLTQQATAAQDAAQAKLKKILDGISIYQSDPLKAGSVVASLKGNSANVASSGGSTSSGTTVTGTTSNPTDPKPEDWSTQSAKWIAELDEVNKQIASTRNVLLKLSASIQSDGKLFAEWEKDGDAAFDRCVSTAADIAFEFGANPLSERYDTIAELARKLPGKPEDVIEKYRLIASLAHRMKEAKSTSDLNKLAAQENKTVAELFETIRDGIGQISGLLELDKTLPGAVWKYGSLAMDMAYNLTELNQLWKNVSVLEDNNVRYAEAVKKLAARMQMLIERQNDLRKKIEAGEPVDFAES